MTTSAVSKRSDKDCVLDSDMAQENGEQEICHTDTWARAVQIGRTLPLPHPVHGTHVSRYASDKMPTKCKSEAVAVTGAGPEMDNEHVKRRPDIVEDSESIVFHRLRVGQEGPQENVHNVHTFQCYDTLLILSQIGYS